MLVMVLLALMGLAATTTTSIEIGVAGNEQAYKESLYRAEAAAMVCAQRLEDEHYTERIEHLTYDWLDDRLQPGGPLDSANWADDRTEELNGQGRFFAIHAGIAPGAVLGLDEPTLHVFYLHGRSEQKRSPVVVQLGYKKRF
jgi:hypothetical protein